MFCVCAIYVYCVCVWEQRRVMDRKTNANILNSRTETFPKRENLELRWHIFIPTHLYPIPTSIRVIISSNHHRTK